jgi:predicted nucleotidyltransferase component of viral defense system
VSATTGLAHSIHVRLVARAKELGTEPQLLLERYALHRLLYRLSISQHAERFLLKGAQLMLLWFGETVRMTRDADLLGFGDLTDANLQSIFADLCDLAVPDDGMDYLADTIRISPIREESVYGGRRVSVQARLGNAKLHLQVDVGLGDAVTPEPEWVELPQLLDLPAVRLRAYRPETSIAEKLETMVSLGLVNSRMKDYFDIYVLSMGEAFDRSVLGRAVGDTFRRRGTEWPSRVPAGLSAAFAEEPGKATQWRGFLHKVDAKGVPDDLGTIVKAVAAFLWPVLTAARDGLATAGYWPPGGPWRDGKDG